MSILCVCILKEREDCYFKSPALFYEGRILVLGGDFSFKYKSLYAWYDGYLHT